MMLAKRQILIILTVILVLLVIGFFVYLRIEGFIGETTSAITCPPCSLTPAPVELKSITSQVAEYTLDLEPAENGTYYIKYYGSESTNDPVGILALNNTTKKLEVQILNENRPELISKWNLNTFFPDKTKCIVSVDKCTNASECTSCLTFTSLYMGNTILSYAPYVENKENQVWITSSTKTSNHSGLLIDGSSSIASKIQDTQNNTVDISQINLNAENETKLTEVLNLISQNLQAYKDTTTSDSGASLSQNSTPIKVNLTLSGNTLGLTPTSTTRAVARFADTNENTPNVRGLLSAYENEQAADAANTTNSVYTLDTALGSVISCPKIDSKDYAISRVGQCNCDLSDLTK
jgi:hypothetical protein